MGIAFLGGVLFAAFAVFLYVQIKKSRDAKSGVAGGTKGGTKLK